MKKISSQFKNNQEYVLRPFALKGHDHEEYLLITGDGHYEVTTDIHFTGNVTGIPGADATGIENGYVLTADTGEALWKPPAGGGLGGDYNIDGGRADSVYLATQTINGGGA